MALLSTPDFPMVRALLGTELGAEELPDALIALPIYQGIAEREIVALVPDAQAKVTAGGADGQRVKNATAMRTAALLAPSMRSILEKHAFETGVRYEKVDWAARAAQLRNDAAAELDELAASVDTSTVGQRPTFFAVASGRRGA